MINKELEIIVRNKKNNIVELTIEYFTKQGFKFVGNEGNNFEFRRGSLFWNNFTFNPLKIKSCINIMVDDNKVNAVFDVDTTGQTILPSEIKLWDEFIANYERTLVEGKINTKSTKQKHWINRFAQFKYLFWLLIIALLVVVIQGSISGAIYWLFDALK